MSHDKLLNDRWCGVTNNLWLKMYTRMSRWSARDCYAIKNMKQNEAQSAPAESTQKGDN